MADLKLSTCLVLALFWTEAVLSGGKACGQEAPETRTTSVIARAQEGPFRFIINPDTPLKDLLPVAPKDIPHKEPQLIDDISQVPEIAFQDSLARTPEARKLIARTMAIINHVNKEKTDGFMEALLRERTDLAGLPIAWATLAEWRVTVSTLSQS